MEAMLTDSPSESDIAVGDAAPHTPNLRDGGYPREGCWSQLYEQLAEQKQ